MRFNLFLLGLTGLAVLAAGSGDLAAQNTKDSLETVMEIVNDEKAVLVDVREKPEWDKGHIEGSIFLPLSSLKKSVKEDQLCKLIPEDRILYTFCVVGKRAVTAAKILEKFGYEVRALKPGYKELVRAGFKQAERKR
jgi:rhodanese-related sulfurtransferase